MAMLFMRFLASGDAAFSTKFISRFQRRIASITIFKQFSAAAAAKPIVSFVFRMAAWAIHHGILNEIRRRLRPGGSTKKRAAANRRPVFDYGLDVT